MSEEPLVIVPMPPLLQVLRWHEEQKGSALTEVEVCAIAKGAPSMALPAPEAAALEQARGYRDISIENAWSDWLAVKGLSAEGDA